MSASAADPRLREIARLREADTTAAERLARTLVAERPDDIEAHRALLSVLSRRVDTAATAEAARAALARHPEWDEIGEALADAHFHAGELEAAYDEIARRPALGRSAETAMRVGVLAHAVGRRDAAFEAFHSGLAGAAGGDAGVQARGWVGLMRLWRDAGRERLADDAARGAQRLYRTKPIWVSSSVSKLVNRRDFPEYERVRRKDGLAGLLAAAAPEARPPAPANYRLPGERDRLLADAAAGRSGPVWIVKAGDLFGGQGISLTDDPAAIPAGVEGVVQHYIDRPLLWRGCKGHLRLYLLVTSAEPTRAWLWHDGLVRFAPEPFAHGPGWLSRLDMHVTNTALHEGHPGLSFAKDATIEDEGSVQGLAAFLRRAVPEEAARAALWDRLDDLARRLAGMLAADGLFARQAAHGRAFLPKLLGLDVLLDADLRPWLLELQRVPGQTGPGPVNTVNARMFRTVFEMTVGPLDRLPGASPAEREAAREQRARGAFRLL